MWVNKNAILLSGKTRPLATENDFEMVQFILFYFFISDCCQTHRTNYWRWSEIPQGPPPERHSCSLGSGRPGKGWERPASPVTSCFAPHVCPSCLTEEEPRYWELGQQWCWKSLIHLNPPAEHHFEIIWTG